MEEAGGSEQNEGSHDPTAASLQSETRKDVTPCGETVAEQDPLLSELEQHKVTMRRRLSSIEKLELLINVLTYKIYEIQHDFRKEMEDLQYQRQELLSRKDMTEPQIAMALAELDKKIADKQNTHEATLTSMEGQRFELQKESSNKVQYLDNTLESIKERQQYILNELEEDKRCDDPSKAAEYDRRICNLKMQFEAEINEFLSMQASGWKQLNTEEKLTAMLDQKGLHVSKSGRMLTKSGQLFTLEEAEKMGLMDDLGMSWHSILKGFQTSVKADDEESVITQETSEASMYSKMSSEDVHYLKESLGKPLTLALAEIIAKQPRDPIHYLGHWLFKYRYNQEVDIITKQQEQELTEERDRLARERWHKILEEEARAAVLDILARVEEEALRNELRRLMEAQRAMEDEEEEGEEEEHQENLLLDPVT